MRLVLSFLFIVLITSIVPAQTQSERSKIEHSVLKIKKITHAIKIDGILDEADWQEALPADNFWKKFPKADGPATEKTVAKVLYDDQFLYVSFIAYDSGATFIQSLKRDFGHDGNDCVAIILDPQNQKTNGFFFVVNSFNAQSEDQLSPGVELKWSWDNKWISATKRTDKYWVAEIAIPFKTLRYADGKKEWAINFLRVDTKTNEYSVWNKVPINFPSYDLGYTGILAWDQAPPPPGRNMVVIPYVTAQASENKEANQKTQTKANAGFDAKIALNSSLNLDLTVNPDFAQVEVDQQVTNLTRFNIFFPERRNFFLENGDLYSEFGIPPIRPFNSRAIGLDQTGRQIPILFGARLTGNISKTTRIGILNMQTGKKDSSYKPENFTAITFNQRIWKRSTVKGYVLNRQAFLTKDEKLKTPLLEYGRNAGVEFNYSDEKGKWNGWGGYHHSFKPGISNKSQYFNFGGQYSTSNFEGVIDFSSLGTNYYADMGYLERIDNYDALRDTIIRQGYNHAFTSATYKIFPKNGMINQHQFKVENYYVVNPDFSFNENNTNFVYGMMFKNTSNLFFNYDFTSVNLQYPTSFTGATPLPIQQYHYNQVSVDYNSDFRKAFGYKISIGGGEFYNGTAFQFESGINYRDIPHLNIAINFNYYNLQFPKPYGKGELFLISPRIEFNFTTNIFWTTFLQYNTQGNNFNINSRFQWRFKPMSDFFLVYTDNYFTDPFLKNKSRAIVMKLQYWLNL